MKWLWVDLFAAAIVFAFLSYGYWLLQREIRWEVRRDRVMRERRYRELFTDWNEENLGPGERLVDGEVMYSADWLNDRRHLKAVK